ncbi:DUF2817 domain-containing protein [Candidatus Woesearchaeota archaeon]|nr:DUF2817 domain-containing protein [Candidatus Woesearchaeota archaeon]
MYSDYLKALRAVCRKRHFSLVPIGHVKHRPLYKVALGKTKPLATVVFSAGIHGDEIAGPLAVLRFLEKIQKRRLAGLRVLIIPVANPTGFDRGKRRNYQNRDINRHFAGKSLEGEPKILYNVLKAANPVFFHSLHEDVDEKRFYLYNYEQQEEKVYRDVIALAKRYFPVNTARKICNRPARDGMVTNVRDKSLEYMMFREGVPFVLCTESPGRQPLEKRIELNYRIMLSVVRSAKKMGKAA